MVERMERSVLYVPLLNISMVLRDRKEIYDYPNNYQGVDSVTHSFSLENLWGNINVLLSTIATAAVVFGAFYAANVIQPWVNWVILLLVFLVFLRTCYKKTKSGMGMFL